MGKKKDFKRTQLSYQNFQFLKAANKKNINNFFKKKSRYQH